MENRFNLVDEAWIPVADCGRVSLRQIFIDPHLRKLGGNAIQKIALTKLLLAIAQSAATPEDDNAWREMGWQGMADKCLSYLDKWHDRFYLYGEQPFLQMPAIQAAALKTLGVVSPEISTGNTTVLTQSQQEQHATDADRAVTLVVQMAFGLSGKKADTLPEGYQDRTVNVFTPPGADAPALNISRDTLKTGETLTAYIDRQMSLMAKHLKGWKTGERTEAVLGDNLVTGEIIHASYLRDGKRTFQQQAVFNPSADHILVFTMSVVRALNDADRALLLSVLKSFCFHA